MKKMKRIAAMLLAMVMVFGMSVTAFAEPTKPTETDAKTVTISGIEGKVTYKAYQIIDAKYDANGFTGYVWAPGVHVTTETTEIKAGEKVTFSKEGENEVVNGLTDELVTTLAADPSGLENKKDPFTTDMALEAGTWMILVTPTEEKPDTVYNPMIVSVYYSVSGSDNTLESGEVNALSNWTLQSTNAFAKSSTIEFKKDMDHPENDTEVAVGDEVPFTLTSVIPSYNPVYYQNPTFKITDTIVNGLKYTGEPKVYLGGTNKENLLEKDTEYTLTYNAESAFEVVFNFEAERIKELVGKTAEGRTVTIKYSAEVLESAVTKVGENKATLEYSKNPTENTTKEDKEYVFSFALHNVFSKQDESKELLKGAEFTLYVEDEDGTESIEWITKDIKKVKTVGDAYTTGEDGDIKFKGLDGDKVYYVKETKAPDGYSINDTVYRVEFEFDKPENYIGDNTSYKVIITDSKTNTSREYTVTYGELVNNDAYGNSPESNSDEVTVVLNTKLTSLPSTGGIGTTIFTIAGCLIMIAAAGLFFASRRKSAK